MPIGKGGRTLSYHNRGRVPRAGKGRASPMRRSPRRPIKMARGGRVRIKRR